MKVLVNALSARRGGSLVYLRNLLPALAAIDQSMQYFILAPADIKLDIPSVDCRNVHIEPRFNESQSLGKRLWLEHLQIPKIVRSGRFSWYFQIDDTVPPLIYLTGIKTLAVFHASIQFVLPDELGDSPVKLAYWRILRSLALKYTTVPVTVSYCTKGELSRGSGRIFRKVQVIYHGVDQKLFNPGDLHTPPSLPDFPEQFILSISTRNPHKNYFRLVKGYHRLVQETNISEHLILIGAPVWTSEESRIRQYVNKHNLSSRVHILDALDNTLLPDLYRKATAYVYPSLFDSFGLTPMEAMACGTPCAVSMFSALPETCGDAAEYFDPLYVESIALALKRVVCDEERKTELVRLGLEHVKRYSWKKSAEAYHRILTSETIPVWAV